MSKHEHNRRGDKSKKSSKEPVDSHSPKPISEEHYFQKAAEFQVWLSEKGYRFHDLSKSEAQDQFKKFIRRWNKGKLDDKYYKGIQALEVPFAARTGYKWNIKDINESEQILVHDSVESMTGSANTFNFGFRNEAAKGQITDQFSEQIKPVKKYNRPTHT
ncbi:hypothetical protein QVD99_001809 [Batrachochytrium dendrobatidis]|nr:hypothetical protein O5D80_000452 [Batrachochytrium dendrobatidis]KAK5671989.1 hypothetical protein QVD99_001809 [Batrachochytrium dendrobatidis]